MCDLCLFLLKGENFHGVLLPGGKISKVNTPYLIIQVQSTSKFIEEFDRDCNIQHVTLRLL